MAGFRTLPGLALPFASSESALRQIHYSCDFLDAPPVVERRVVLVEALGSAVFLRVAFFSVHCVDVAVQVVPAALLVALVAEVDSLVHVF